MQLTDDDLVEMMTAIWDIMIGDELTNIDIDPDHEFGLHTSIDIVSPDGTVLRVAIEHDAAVAVRVAEAMFDLTPDEVTDGDASEAIGEVTNIFGGNVKGVLGLSATLSFPTVVGAPLAAELYPGATLNRVGFEASGLLFVAVIRDLQLVS